MINSSTAYVDSQPSWVWIYNVSNLCPECSAVLEGDYQAFYFAHLTALVLASTSFICCFVVIFDVLKGFRSEFGSLFEAKSSPSRFPLIIAITDAIRSAAHGSDHFYLLHYQTCPTPQLANVFGALESWGVGYQHSMQSGLAVGMYFKICQGCCFWGTAEWKLHTMTFFNCAGMAFFSIMTEVYGCSPGFWFGYRSDTGLGVIYAGFIINLIAVLWGITFACFIAIRRKVSRHGNMGLQSTKSNSCQTATECLTTYIFVSLLLYFPLAVGCWTIFVTTAGFQFVEYSTVLLIIVTANSLGSANALAYLYNRRLRRRQAAEEWKRRRGSSQKTTTNTNC